MKRKIFTTTALVCCFMVCFAITTDIGGKWVTTIKGQDGNDFQLNYMFKVDGNKLTGSVTSPQGEIPISDGKVNGDDFSFTISFNGNDIKSTGKYYTAGDSAGVNTDFNGMKFHSQLKRDSK